SAWWGATAALAMLTIFIAAIVMNLARGRTPDCHCFGTLHSEPVGWTTVVRNALLAGMAGVVAWRGPSHAGPGFADWISSATGAELMFLGLTIAVGALAAFESVMVYQLLAQNGRMIVRIESLEAKLGSRA